MTKITAEDFGKILAQYHRAKRDQRFGQYICNYLNITDSTLFFEENEERAIEIFVANYIS